MSVLSLWTIPLLAVSLNLSGPNSLFAQTSDPTQMSPQIAELLQGISAGQNQSSAASGDEAEAAEPVAPALLRMRGLILRNDDAGTACLVLDDDRVMVRLDRQQLGKIRFAIGGQQYEVIDFHRYGLELRNLSTTETLHVN